MKPLFSSKKPPGDEKFRQICDRCGFIDYVNPKIVAGSVVVKGDKFLLCRRAIAPRIGYWTLPAGFMEEGESVEQAAMREAMEEANATLKLDRLLAIYSIPRLSQVQIMYRAELVSDISPGVESQDVALFEWKDIPWRELAFPSVVWALTQYAKVRGLKDFAPFTNPPDTDGLTL